MKADVKIAVRSILWSIANFALNTAIVVAFIMIWAGRSNMLENQDEFIRMITVISVFAGIPVTLFLYKVYRKRYLENWELLIEWNIEKINLKTFFYSVLAVFLLFAINGVITIGLQLDMNGSETTEILFSGGIIAHIATVLIAPINEEIFFRGILGKMFEKSSEYLFYIMSFIIFGAMHIQDSGVLINDIAVVLITGIGGVVFAVLYRKTKNIYLTILSHIIYNSSMIFLMSMRG